LDRRHHQINRDVTLWKPGVSKAYVFKSSFLGALLPQTNAILAHLAVVAESSVTYSDVPYGDASAALRMQRTRRPYNSIPLWV